MASYQKLVRDLIPKIIEENGKKPMTHILCLEDFKKELNKKLLEEANEFVKDQNLEELADILEVIYTLLDVHHWSFDELEQRRKEKAQERGGFKNRIFLEGVTDGNENKCYENS